MHPPRLARWLLRLRPLGSRRAEIEADLAEVFADRLARDGRLRAAARYYGDVLSVWTWNSAGETWVSGIAQDLTHASRVFRRSPGAVAVAVAGLSLAIAVSTSIFSLLNAVVFRPVGISDPDSAVLVLRAQKTGISSSWSFAEYLALRESRPYAIEAFLRGGARLSPTPVAPNDMDGQPVRMTFVSGGYLAAFGASPFLGRLLTPADDAAGTPPVVAVSYGFWARRLNADTAIVGRRIWLNGVPVTIAGVAGRSFTDFLDQAPAFWAPFSAYRAFYNGSPLSAGSRIDVDVVGRIAKNETREQVQAQLTAAVAAAGGDRRRSEPATGVRLEPAGSRFRNSAEVRIASIVVAMVVTIMALIFALACVNVANLQLASAIARHREIGVRLALGASRARVVRQLLTESVTLGMVGGAAALVLTVWMVPAIAIAIRAPVTVDVAPDLRVYTFLALISLAAGVGCGLAPAKHGTRGDLLMPLKGEGSRAESSRPARLRATLIGAQAMASILLLIVAALLTRATLRAIRIDVGFDANHVVAVTPVFGRDSYDEARRRIYWQQALERVRGLAGVRSASLADVAPFGGLARAAISNRHGRRHTTLVNYTDQDYFSTLGVRVVRGRVYMRDEAARGAPVAVVSESMAREFWPGVDPIGRSLEPFDGNANVTIIGVVTDAITARSGDLASATLYRPLENLEAACLVIRTSGAPEALVPALRDALQPLDPRARLHVTLAAAGLEKEVDEPRMLAWLAGALAALALGLAIVGLYGVTSFVAGQRTREIGVRISVGATPADVTRLLLADSLRPVAFGLAAGVIVALVAGRAFAGVLYGVTAHDPIAVTVAVALLTVSAAAAVFFPTRRAARVDPAAVLRQS